MLYESVVVTTDRAESDLLSLVEKEDSAEVEMIKSLAIRRGTEGGGPRVMEALLEHLCDQVETLTLFEVDFSVCEGAQNLRRLLLQSANPVMPRQYWGDGVAFPQLHTFHVVHSARSISLPAQHFPLLRSFYSDDSLLVPSPALFGRLTALHLEQLEGYEELLPRAGNLKLLSISMYNDDQELFSLLNATPRFLRLQRHSVRVAAFALRYQVENKPAALGTIYWDYDADLAGDEDDEDIEDDDIEGRVDEFVTVLAEGGVHVVRETIGFRNAIERMEATLAKEERAAEDKERAGK